MRHLLILCLIFFLVAAPVHGASPAVLRMDWSGLQQNINDYKLTNRTAWITLSGGERIKAAVVRASESGLVVRQNDKTLRYPTGDGVSTLPRDRVESIQFTGKLGKGGLIGGLAGLGGGVLLAGASASGDCEGPACAAGAIFIPIGAVAGYFIGRGLSKPAPTFVLNR